MGLIEAVSRRLVPGALQAFDPDALDYRPGPGQAERSPGQVHFVRAADIDWIKTASNHVRLHPRKASPLLRESLSCFAARLDPERFLRGRRMKAANMRELPPWFSEFIANLPDAPRLESGRGPRERMTRWVGQTL